MAKAISRLQAELSKLLLLGTGVGSGDNIFVPLEDLKKTSVHVVGAAGYGKSFVLRKLILQFISYGQPFALIDPHKELYEFAVSALHRSATRPEKIVLLDPGDDRHSIAFNPLCCGITDPGEASSLVLEAVAKAWNAPGFDNTPRLERLLRGTFRLLADNNLTLLEAPDVLNVDNRALRQVLCENVSDAWVRQDWQEYDKWPRAERIALVESSRNRLQRFMQSASVQLMLGQRDHALNMQRVMDDGHVFLANVGNTPSPETKRLLGALVVNAIYHAAKQRNPRRRKDFFVIIDECGQFATRDLANSLDELRKFGVHLILAHQRLKQLECEDGDILSAVMTNAKAKVVLGGLQRIEAEQMARELFTGQVRGDRVKHVALATKFRPILDTFEVITESSSTSESVGESDTESEGESESSGSSETTASGTQESGSQVYSVDEDTNLSSHEDDDIVTRTLGEGSSESESESTSFSQTSQRSSSRSSSRQSGWTEGTSRSVVPITRHEQFTEETGRQFWGIDEQWEELIAAVHQLGKREALVRLHNGPVLHIRTAEVQENTDERATNRFKERAVTRSPYVSTADEVVREIDVRRRRLADVADKQGGRPFNVKSFKEK